MIITLIIIIILLLVSKATKNAFMVYTQNTSGASGTLVISEIFDYPTCINGCISENNTLIPQFRYRNSGKCFKAINSIPTTSLDLAIQKEPTSVGLFSSCTGTSETRYILPIGRYIRITRLIASGAMNDLFIRELTIFNKANISIPAISTHSQPAISTTYMSDYLTDNTTAVAGASGLNSYIQADIGSDMEIGNIVITANTTNFIDLQGTKLQIINSAGTIVTEMDIVNGTPGIDFINTNINTIPVFDNVYGNKTLGVSLSFSFPECDTVTYQGCVSGVGKNKPNFTYRLPDGRCLISKNICSTNNCMTNINAYNNIVTPSMILNDFYSCTGLYNTQFSTVTGQYVRLLRVNNTNPITINDIEVYDKYNNLLTDPIKVVVTMFPSGTGNTNSVIDGVSSTGITTGTGTNVYVDLDLGSNKEIAMIILKSSDPVSLANIKLIVANSTALIVYQQTFTTSPDSIQIYTQNVATYTELIIFQNIAKTIILVRFDSNGPTELSGLPGLVQTIVPGANPFVFDTTKPVILPGTSTPISNGSMKFNGTSSCVYTNNINTTALNLDGDFTIQFWAYYSINQSSAAVINYAGHNAGIVMMPSNSGTTLYINGGVFSTINRPINQWIFYTLRRTAGVIEIYQNTTKVLTWTNNFNITNLNSLPINAASGNYISISSSYYSSGGTQFIGWMYDFRVVKGEALPISIPTGPLGLYP